MLTYKTVPFALTELKAEGDLWTFSGYASTFGGIDLGGDRVMPGAFDKTLAARPRRPLLWQHDITEPIGREKSLVIDEHGLLGTWEIIPTTRGRDAYALLKAGAIDAMSIGYIVEEYKFDDGGVRELMTVDLLENSVVTLGMNEDALVTAVKAAQLADAKYMGGGDAPEGTYEALSHAVEEAIEAAMIPAGADGYVYVLATWGSHAVARVVIWAPDPMSPMGESGRSEAFYDVPYVANADGTLTLGTPTEVDEVTSFVPVKGFGIDYGVHTAQIESDVRGFVTRSRAGSALRVKVGRAISEARRTRMASVSGALRTAADEIDAMLDETAPAPPPKVMNMSLELRRRRLARHGIDLGVAAP